MAMPGWRVAVLAAALLGACESSPPADDPNYQRYLEDKRRCESISRDETAQKSCMTYRGWKDGKYRR